MSSPEHSVVLNYSSSYRNASHDGRLDLALKRSVAEVLTIATILTAIVVVTVAGNLLVIATVWTNRNMHNVTNYFLVSLATTDLLLGFVVLPLSVVNTLNPYWPFGAIFCNIYISCDVMLCTVSILTLFAISLDRYFAVTTPLRYKGRMNSRIVWRVSAGIWMFALIMAFLPIHFGWNTPDGRVQNTDAPEVCFLASNGPYVLLVSLGTYFAPLIIMSAVYIRVLQITRQQVKEINKLGRLARTLSKTNHKICRQKTMTEATHSDSRRNYFELPTAHSAAIVSDRKATVNLASVVLAFAICWIPYFVLFTLKPFFELHLSSGFGYHFDLFALWLGYANSSINPFLYAFYNSSFRNGFRRLLCSHWPMKDSCSAGIRSCDGLSSTGNGRGSEGTRNDCTLNNSRNSRGLICSPKTSLTGRVEVLKFDLSLERKENIKSLKLGDESNKTRPNGNLLIDQKQETEKNNWRSKNNFGGPMFTKQDKGSTNRELFGIVVNRPSRRRYLSVHCLSGSMPDKSIPLTRPSSWYLSNGPKVSVV